MQICCLAGVPVNPYYTARVRISSVQLTSFSRASQPFPGTVRVGTEDPAVRDGGHMWRQGVSYMDPGMEHPEDLFHSQQEPHPSGLSDPLGNGYIPCLC